MYARRRILAILVVLLLLALLLPRACQALMGSDNQAGGPGGEQQAAAGTDSGAGTGEGSDADDAGADDPGADDARESDPEKDEDADDSKEEPSDRGAPFLDDDSDDEDGSGGEEAPPDLLALITPITAVGDEEASGGGNSSASEEGGSGGGSSGSGGEPQADDQPLSENQFAMAASRTPEEPSSWEKPAPTRRTGPAEAAPVAERDAASRSERIRARADRLAATPVAEPAALQGAGQGLSRGQSVVEPVATETFGTAPVAPAQATVPAAVSSGPAFVPTQAGALNGAGAAPGALPAGPRLAGPGATGTLGPAF